MTCNKQMGFMCLAFLFVAGCQVLPEKQPQGIAERGAAWLTRQQHPRTRLIRSFNSNLEKKAMTYDQAAGTIALAHAGRQDAAVRCADAMLALRDPTRAAWADSYDWGTAKPNIPAVAAGPNAWMGLALATLYKHTGDKKYLAAAAEAAQFLRSLQNNSGGPADGSIRGGYDEQGRPFNWTATEHCADALALFLALHKLTGKEEYRSDARRILTWLNSQMWDEKTQSYRPGYSNNETREISEFPERLDSQTWTALAACAGDMQLDIRNGLPWIDNYKCRVETGTHTIIGFGKITLGPKATPSVWTEGTAGYVIAARRLNHKPQGIPELLDSLRITQQPDGSVPYSIGVSCPDVIENSKASDLVVCTFEAHPNCLGGEVGIYGDGQPNWKAITAGGFAAPYSWYYEPGKPGWRKENVHTGFQSFRLVNDTAMCDSQKEGWASLGIELGPAEGKRIRPVDARPFQFLEFWGKAEGAAGARVKVLLRDAHAPSAMPRVAIAPDPPVIGPAWQRHRVDLRSLGAQIDLSEIVHAGLAFGKDAGNAQGTIIYVDDVAFIAAPEDSTDRGGRNMPILMPQNWPDGSVAGTAWLVLVELDVNPFECQ